MSIGEGLDTLRSQEQSFLRSAAAAQFPNHSFSIRHGEDGLAWAVIAPRLSQRCAICFTICRIDPCLMVMVEDREARRQFRSAANVEDAMAFVQMASEQAILSSTQAHPAPEAVQ